MFVSIVLTTYNGAKFIHKQIASILNQSFSDFELIVCDDCSIDCTYSIIKEFPKQDSRVKVYQNKFNLGFLKNFEHAISLCSGEYIACCDQDDVWEKDHLEILLTHIEENDCIGANALLVDENLTSLRKTHAQSLNVFITPESSQNLFRHECYYNLIQGTASLFKRDLLTSILPFPQGIKFHDHWIALNACIRNGCKYIPKAILQYRCHSQNITGYHKFKLLHALQTVKRSSKYRTTIYQHNLAMLQSVLPHITESTQQNIAKEAIEFFTNLTQNKNKFKSVLFYIRNYESITLCPKRKRKLFLYRVLCIFLFGIMQ